MQDSQITPTVEGASSRAAHGYPSLRSESGDVPIGVEREGSGRRFVTLAEGVTLHLADCREVMPIVADAIVTDPPYGMGYSASINRGNKAKTPSHWKGAKTKNHGKKIMHDDEPFDPSPWLEYPIVVLWGMVHFCGKLPPGSALVWIKRYEESFGSFLSDADIAWMKGGCGIYCKRDTSLQKLPKYGGNEGSSRSHPTQKPVPLMEWCLERAKVPIGATVLDPYMGSGSTGLASIRTGRRFVGIEKDPAHFETAVRRIRAELAQGVLPLGGIQTTDLPQ